MTAGERLREARKSAGHRSARLAAKSLGVLYSTYLSHENGQNGFGGDQAKKYADAFGVSPAYLLTGDNTEPAIVALVDLLIQKGVITYSEAEEVLSSGLEKR